MGFDTLKTLLPAPLERFCDVVSDLCITAFGIGMAWFTGELAAEVAVQAMARPAGPGRERALQAYPEQMKARYGGYYTLGRVFVGLIGNPSVMKLATRHGLPHPLLMRFTLKLLANLTDPRGGDAMDRVINALTKVAPAA